MPGGTGDVDTSSRSAERLSTASLPSRKRRHQHHDGSAPRRSNADTTSFQSAGVLGAVSMTTRLHCPSRSPNTNTTRPRNERVRPLGSGICSATVLALRPGRRSERVEHVDDESICVRVLGASGNRRCRRGWSEGTVGARNCSAPGGFRTIAL